MLYSQFRRSIGIPKLLPNSQRDGWYELDLKQQNLHIGFIVHVNQQEDPRQSIGNHRKIVLVGFN